MIDGIEFWLFISRKHAIRLCRKFNLTVKKGYATRREIRLNEDDLKLTFKRDGTFKHLFIEVRRNKHNDYVLTVKGSLHKFYHDNNKGLFRGEELLVAIESLNDLFEIDLENAIVENVEVGVNLIVWFSVYEYLKSNLIYHKKKTCEEFKKRGIGYVFEYNDYSVKCYEKDIHVFRFETKYKSQTKIDLFGIRKLGDINQNTVNNLVISLVREWDEVFLRGGLNIYNKNDWQVKMTQQERDKLRDYTSIAYQQSYQEDMSKADSKGKEALRKKALRLRNFCIALINEKGDGVHQKLRLQIEVMVKEFIENTWGEKANVPKSLNVKC